MRKSLLLTLYFTFITCSLGAQSQDNIQDNIPDNIREEEQHLTYDQMTELMVSELHLDEKQQNKLTKINRRFKNLIEGDHRQPPMMGGRLDGQKGDGMPDNFEGGDMSDSPRGYGMSGGPRGGGMSGGPMGGGMSGGMSGGPRGGGMGGGPRGGGMGGGGMMGGPGAPPESYDYDRQQRKYDKAVRKLFSDEQFEDYQKIKSKFYSQRRIRDYLLGDQSRL